MSETIFDSFVVTGYQNEARPVGDLLVTPTGGTQGSLADLLGASFGGPFLPLAGGTMSGPLVLAGQPVTDMQAATKFYVDDTVADLASISAITGQFVVRTATVAGDPGSGNMRFNTTGQTDATALFISGTSANGINFQNIWTKLVPGFKISVQESANPANIITFTVGSAPIDHVTWVTIPVTSLGGAGFPVVDQTLTLVTSFGLSGGPWLPLSGGTVTGSIRATGNISADNLFFAGTDTIQGGSVINGPVSTGRRLTFQTASSNRWQLGTSVAAETGSNVGTDFSIFRFGDNGASIDAPFSIIRSTGQTFILQGLRISAPAVTAGSVDLSRHIMLNGTQYGFNVQTGPARINYIVPSGASHAFMINGVDQVVLNNLQVLVGNNTVASSIFLAINSASGVQRSFRFQTAGS